MPISPLRAAATALRRPEPRAAAARPALVPANTRLAVIGDSHTAWDFGKQLRPLLKAHLHKGGGKITSFDGIPSASVSHFLEGGTTHAGNQTFTVPPLSTILARKPKVLMVALGTNMLANSNAVNKAQIRALLAKADKAGTKVVWVGPPDVEGLNGGFVGPKPEARFYATLRAVNAERAEAGLAAMKIIDSRKSTKEGDTLDGLHFGGAHAKKWAQSVFAAAT